MITFSRRCIKRAKHPIKRCCNNNSVSISCNLWMRFNCRHTCGMCHLGMRGVLSATKQEALKAAMQAAVARNSPTVATLAEQRRERKWAKRAQREG